jgi:2,3,4,5-tetrahydropyridine-2-carboxylate N-succinyltransferase
MAEEGGAAVKTPAQRHERDLGGPGKASWWASLKIRGLGETGFATPDFARCQGRSSPLRLHCRNVVLMPSFVSAPMSMKLNSDRHLVDRRKLRADRQARAYFGRRRHRRRAGALAGRPVIVEDDCFIGARSEVADATVRKGAVLAMGASGRLDQNRRPRDRRTFVGEVPEYAVVVPGALPGKPEERPARPRPPAP